MITTPKIAIHNVETGQVEIRDFNDKELAEAEAQKAADNQVEQASITKEAARQALLDKLGITADEAKLLLG
jgi:hypothetical protein